MRRPAGVVVTCIVLGLIACILLLTTGLFLFLSTMIGHLQLPTAPGQPAPDPRILSTVMIAAGLIFLLPTAWATATLVGLARMKSWARYSVIAIGCCLVLFAFLGIMGTILSQTILRSAMPPGQSPEMLRIGIIFNILFELVILGIGAWWIVYFALRTTRDAFALAARPTIPPLSLYPQPLSPYAPATYQVASYTPATDLEAPRVIYPPPVELQVPAQDAPPSRPLAVSIIGWLFIVGAILTLPYAFLPFPIFFLGVTLTGAHAHLTMICFALISALIGIGLLRLEKIALYAACAMQCVGIVNTGLLFMPGYRDRMMTYMDLLMQKSSFGMTTPPMFDSHLMGLMMLPGMFLGLGVCLTVLILLIRNRAAFDRAQAAA